MEQHVENVIKSAKERDKRRMQLEEEMEKVGFVFNIHGCRMNRIELLNYKDSGFPINTTIEKYLFPFRPA